MKDLRRLLADLDGVQRDIAQFLRIYGHSFSSINLEIGFDALLRVSDRGIQTLLRQIDIRTLGRALKVAGKDYREIFFRNMSARAEALLGDELADPRPVTVDQVVDAQEKVVDVLRQLEGQGEIILDPLPGETGKATEEIRDSASFVRRAVDEIEHQALTSPAGRAFLAEALVDVAPQLEWICDALSTLAAKVQEAKALCSGGEKTVGVCSSVGTAVEALKALAVGCKQDAVILRSL